MVPESTRRGFLAAAATGAFAGCNYLQRGGSDSSPEATTPDQRRSCSPVEAVWPTAGGDARRSGYAPDIEPPALDADTARFSLPANGTTTARPAVGPDHVFVPHPGGVRAFTRDPLERAWTASDVDATVVAVGCDTCFAATRTRLAALDPADGTVRWDVVTDGAPGTRSLAVVGSTLFAGSAAYDAATGDVVFEGDPVRENAVGRYLYVGGDTVAALDRTTGETLWTADEDWSDVTRVAVGAGVIAVTAGVDFVTALDARTGERLWRSESLVEVFAAPAVTDDAVVVPSGAGEYARCFDAESGDQRWRAKTGRCPAPPVIVGDTVVFATAAESWAAVGLDDGAVRGRFDVAGSGQAPAVADGRFFYRHGNGNFYVTG